jgi:hypothetical protein
VRRRRPRALDRARRGRRHRALAAAGDHGRLARVVYATIDDRLYGGLHAVVGGGVGRRRRPAPGSLGDYLSRHAAAGGPVDRPRGRAAPLGADARARRVRRLAVVALAPARGGARSCRSARDAEAAAGLSLLVCGTIVLVAAFAAPTLTRRLVPGPPPRGRVPARGGLVAWGLRHAPRAGAVLGALTLLGSAWLALAFAFGGADGWVRPGVDAPYGPRGRAAAARRLGLVRGRGGGPGGGAWSRSCGHEVVARAAPDVAAR